MAHLVPNMEELGHALHNVRVRTSEDKHECKVRSEVNNGNRERGLTNDGEEEQGPINILNVINLKKVGGYKNCSDFLLGSASNLLYIALVYIHTLSDGLLTVKEYRALAAGLAISVALLAMRAVPSATAFKIDFLERFPIEPLLNVSRATQQSFTRVSRGSKMHF
ncbi:hypothetical protein Fmac_008374 [Flemingia macrophylla]|uniref:Uncharacterized protein n=1 Tax=Flemingia macrophylla TaxID=520843 RepID=A0ABD1MXB1_9FABA